MATIYKGYSFGATEQVTAAKLHSLVDSATIASIATADISNNAVTNDKILSVDGSKLTGLASIPSGSGTIPDANLPAMVKTAGDQTVAGVKTFSSFPITPSSAPTTDYQFANKKFVDDAVAGLSDSKGFTGMQVFTSSGTWTKPANVTAVHVSAWGGGGAGGSRNQSSYRGGGGGSGAYAEGVIAVTGNVTVTVGAGGTCAGQQQSGSAGGNSTFAGSTTLTAGGGGGGLGGASYTGGSSGTASNGVLNYNGNAGQDGGNGTGGTGGTAIVNTYGQLWGQGGQGVDTNSVGGAGTQGVVIVTW